jgi:hypothetical protein
MVVRGRRYYIIELVGLEAGERNDCAREQVGDLWRKYMMDLLHRTLDLLHTLYYRVHRLFACERRK